MMQYDTNSMTSSQAAAVGQGSARRIRSTRSSPSPIEFEPEFEPSAPSTSTSRNNHEHHINSHSVFNRAMHATVYPFKHLPSLRLNRTVSQSSSSSSSSAENESVLAVAVSVVPGVPAKFAQDHDIRIPSTSSDVLPPLFSAPRAPTAPLSIPDRRSRGAAVVYSSPNSSIPSSPTTLSPFSTSPTATTSPSAIHLEALKIYEEPIFVRRRSPISSSPNGGKVFNGHEMHHAEGYETQECIIA